MAKYVDLGGQRLCSCTWFDDKQVLQRQSFIDAQLEVVDEKDLGFA